MAYSPRPRCMQQPGLHLLQPCRIHMMNTSQEEVLGHILQQMAHAVLYPGCSGVPRSAFP